MRGDVHRLRAPRAARGSEQRGAGYGVIVQSDDLLLSTLLVAPTSRSAPPRIVRPTMTIGEDETQVLVEQTAAVAPGHLAELVGHGSSTEQEAMDSALRLGCTSTDAYTGG